MYTNAQYQTGTFGDITSISVWIDGKQYSVPLDPANIDYQNIMALVEKGELTIAPATTQ